MNEDEIVSLMGTTLEDMAKQNEVFVERVLKEFSATVDTIMETVQSGVGSSVESGNSKLLAAAMIMAFSNKGPGYALERLKELEILLKE